MFLTKFKIVKDLVKTIYFVYIQSTFASQLHSFLIETKEYQD